MSIQRPRGTFDLLPGTIEGWQRLERIVRQHAERANFGEIRTPLFEHTELFERGVGDTTDIVEKEMYTFPDKGNRSMTLRPEGTAGVTRAFVEEKLYGSPGVTKLYYMGPMFRYEKPQRGRWRQFHQYGCEALGTENPAIDAEIIQLNLEILRDLGLQALTVELNSVGCPVCRPRHKTVMIEKLTPVKDELCSDCQKRLDRNPLRIFDCKVESCQAAIAAQNVPKMLDLLCGDCETHFASVKTYLDVLAVPYLIAPDLVRGLDYYTRTAWEITSPGYSTISGGGRYNSLVAEIGGPETPGIGFAGGMERALLVLAEQTGTDKASGRTVDAFVAVLSPEAEQTAMRLLAQLRAAGYVADRDYQNRSVKAQFKMADRMQAKFVVALGEEELAGGYASVKNLAAKAQQEVPLTNLIEWLKNEWLKNQATESGVASE